MAQTAENDWFGKPCGLMDQAASAVGGIVAIDFENEAAPRVEKVAFDFAAAGYRLCIVRTGGSHSDLTPDYAAVPNVQIIMTTHSPALIMDGWMDSVYDVEDITVK